MLWEIKETFSKRVCDFPSGIAGNFCLQGAAGVDRQSLDENPTWPAFWACGSKGFSPDSSTHFGDLDSDWVSNFWHLRLRQFGNHLHIDVAIGAAFAGERVGILQRLHLPQKLPTQLEALASFSCCLPTVGMRRILKTKLKCEFNVLILKWALKILEKCHRPATAD